MDNRMDTFVWMVHAYVALTCEFKNGQPEWDVLTCESKNEQHKYTSLIEIGLHAQNLLTIWSSIVSMIEATYMTT